jgi:hypothetical protein
MSCTHTQKKPDTWVTVNCFGEETEGEWVRGETVSTTRDLDTHRYQCTQCGLVMYYSGRAQAHFERGVPLDI